MGVQANMWKEGHWKYTVNGLLMNILVLDEDEFKEEDGVPWLKLKLVSTSENCIDNTACNLELYWAILHREGYGLVSEDGEKIQLDNGGTLDWLDAEEYMIMTAKDPADN